MPTLSLSLSFCLCVKEEKIVQEKRLLIEVSVSSIFNLSQFVLRR